MEAGSASAFHLGHIAAAGTKWAEVAAGIPLQIVAEAQDSDTDSTREAARRRADRMSTTAAGRAPVELGGCR